jgi:hypothetical protein
VDAATAKLNIRRGLIATGIGLVVGGLIPATAIVAFGVYRLLFPSHIPSGRLFDFLADLSAYWKLPVFGCAVFLGCAAWATYSPPGAWRFSLTLATLVIVSVASWMIFGAIEDAMQIRWSRRSRADDPSELRLAHMILIFVPNAIAAHLIAVKRCSVPNLNADKLG